MFVAGEFHGFPCFVKMIHMFAQTFSILVKPGRQ